MRIAHDLVRKFLRNQCTDAEAEFVEQYFNSHPDEIDQYIPLDEWLEDNERRLEPTDSRRMLQKIRESSYSDKRQPGISSSIVRYLVAASLVSIVIWGSMKLFTKTGKRMPVPMAAGTVPVDNSRGLKLIENNTSREMTTKLPDGSLTIIYPGSSLQYRTSFEKNRRDLYLKGKALFEVSKDESRPFTVYAAGIATTALGTRFLVTEMSDRKVVIALMHGSIKVWPQYARGEGRQVILRPGDKLVVSSGEFGSYSLTHGPSKNPNSLPGKPVPEQSTRSEAWFVFKNHSLKEVFWQIEQKFEVNINIEGATGIEDKLFTGTFLRNDNLEFILKTICSQHSLQYNIDSSTVTITPQ